MKNITALTGNMVYKSLITLIYVINKVEYLRRELRNGLFVLRHVGDVFEVEALDFEVQVHIFGR